jgi:hypothetical protein
LTVALVNRIRKGYAVLWRAAGYDKLGGKRRWTEPVEIRLRWEGSTEMNQKMFAINETNAEVVYLNPADAVKKGDVLWQGKLIDLPAEMHSNPFIDAGAGVAWAVARLSVFPSIKYRPRKKLIVGVLGPLSKLEN